MSDRSRCLFLRHAYLDDVITRIVDSHPTSRLDELLPWAYSAAPNFKAVA